MAPLTTLYVSGKPLEGPQLVRESPLIDGALVSVDDPALSILLEPEGAVELRVVGGMGAGVVHWLGVGESTVGSSAGCAVRLDIDGLAAHAFTVSVDLETVVSVTPVEGVPISLDGEVVEAPVPWPEGAMLHAGPCVLEVRSASLPDAALEPSDDGVGLDYNRPPRLLPAERETTFVLPTEPKAPRGRGIPVIAMLAPLLFAGAIVLVTGNPRYGLFALMSPILLIGNWLSQRSSGKKNYRQEMKEYREQRRQVEDDAAEALRLEREQRRSMAPDPAEAALIAIGPRTRLWERRRDDPDYLALRVGLQELPSQIKLEDPGQLSHRRKVEWSVPDAPVTISLAERGVVGIAGRPELARPVAAWMVAQAAILHSPRDLQLYVLSGSSGQDTWEWMRWLPHCHPALGQDSVMLLGTDAESLGRRVAELQSLITDRRSTGARDTGMDSHVVAVLDGARRLRSLPGVATVLKEGPSVGVYAICLDTEERLLPEECSAVIIQSSPTTVTVRQQRTDVVTDARADIVPSGWFARVARALAPVRDVTDDGGDSTLPSACRLLDVMDLEPPTAQRIAAVWRAAGRTTEALVGVSVDGPFAIDLRRDGPHGLVAGTTGAGKSELLQTLVASLAAANRPDAMTFVLIDYKGGSAFKDCVNLPHTVGMVTDLDAHLVERALTSLGAELQRREHILAAVGAKDIEDYTDLGDKRGGLDPLPRLVLVIDEFASMVRDLPDFVPGLVNIAQRGRSLGIHLLLATQRPSGVVSQDIRANTNLRIALRVTDKAESSDVIDAPDAALIAKNTPGRAYVRLGHASLVPFQAGRVGGRRPGTSAAVRREPWLVPLEWLDLGRPVPQRPRPRVDQGDVEVTDLGVLVAAIRDANDTIGGPPQHSPWLPALPDRVTISELPAVTDIGTDLPPVPWAVADIPRRQEQRAEVIDFARFGHKLIVGAGRSGRTQALRTIASSIAENVRCDEVHMYAIDCGSGGLLPLADLPHCGAVVQRTQPERAVRLLGRLLDEVTRRQEVLAAGGYANLTEQRLASPPQDRMPHIVVLLDRWEGFTASLGELDGGRPQAAMMTLLGEGASVGVHCVIAGDRTLGSYRIMSLTEDRLVLRMNDDSDYTTLGLNPRKLPDSIVDGRGFQAEGLLETQVAVLPGELTGQGQAAAVREIGARTRGRDAAISRGRRPFRIDVLPASLTLETAFGYLAGDEPAMFAMVGIGGDDLEALGPDLARRPLFMLGGPSKSGRSTALLAMVRTLLKSHVEVGIIAPRPSPLRDLLGEPGVRGVVTDSELSSDVLADLVPDEGPFVLAVDDAEMHKETPAAAWLKTYIRTTTDTRRALLVAGTASDLSGGFTGWHAEARKGRTGALLSPQGASEGELVGVRLPRSAVVEQVKPGKALLHLGDGMLITVTVPFG